MELIISRKIKLEHKNILVENPVESLQENNKKSRHITKHKISELKRKFGQIFVIG